jgi:hypothetical protein
MFVSLSTHLNQPSKLRESVIVMRRRWLSQFCIMVVPSSLVKGSRFGGASAELDIRNQRNWVINKADLQNSEPYPAF